MTKLGEIIGNIIQIENYQSLEEKKEEHNYIINSDPIVTKWKGEEIQTKLKIAMEMQQPDRGAPGIEYPNYISWVEHTKLELLRVSKGRAEFQMKYRFSAERVIRDFGYVFLKILKDISPSIRSLRISSPDDKMFRCERAIIYEE